MRVARASAVAARRFRKKLDRPRSPALLERLQSSKLYLNLSWICWGIVGFAIGLALGVTTLSASLIAIGLGLFAVFLALNGPARRESEGRLFAGGGMFIVMWLVGFAVRGLAL